MILDNYRLRKTKKFLKERYKKYGIVGRFRTLTIWLERDREITIFFNTIKKPRLSIYHLRQRKDITSIYSSTSYSNVINNYTFETGVTFKIIK